MVRSVLAVLAGFVVMALMVMPASIISARLMLGVRNREEMMRMTPTPPYLAVNVTFSAVFAIIGGYVTATIASHNPMMHAVALAAFMFVMGLASALQNLKLKTPGGLFYSGSLVVLGPTCALIGGFLRSRS